MQFKNSSRQQLLEYVARQIEHFFPDHHAHPGAVLEKNIDEALLRLNICINAARMWKPNEFNYLHSSQYAIFLYFLANTIWRNQKNEIICTKLFYLNKILNGIDCFYEIEMPDIFFIGHSVGIVLAKATYSNYLVVYQNSTVGKNHGIAPVLEEGVVMYPNTAVIGSCHIGKNTVISQGVSIIGHDTPGDCMVFAGSDGNCVFKKSKRNVLADIFRLD